MDYFVVKPNYAELAQYYRISVPPTYAQTIKTDKQKREYLDSLTKEASLNGVELFVEAYHNSDKVWKFDSDHIDLVTDCFNKLIVEHDLDEHRDNILFLIVSLVQSTNSYYSYTQYETFDHNQRLKELANYILSFKDRPESKDYEISLKLTDRESKKLIDTVKITDNLLIHWMSKFVIDAIDNGKAPVYLFGTHENTMLRNSLSGPTTIRELRRAALIENGQVHHSRNKQTMGNICLTIIPYLNGETHLKVAEGKQSNDKQLKFLYELCVMFDLINKEFDEFSDVTPIRYMRILLSDTLKSLKKNKVENP